MIYTIIPNYNGKHHLETCLHSLKSQSYNDYQIIIVDNGSNDSSVKFIQQNFPDVEIIPLKANYGFSKAVNIGIKKALENPDLSYIMLLNNDIECDANFLREMLNGFKNDEIGSVACKMLNYYNRNIIDDTGIIVDYKNLPVPRGYSEVDSGQYDKEEYIFGACAGAAIYRKEIFNKVGLFDEDFISYYEDVDFSFRLKNFGFKCFYNPKAICFHKRGGTSNSNIPYRIFLTEKNIIALRVKNYPLYILVIYLPLFFFKSIWGILRNVFTISPIAGYKTLMGTIYGIFEIPKSIRKRRIIKKLTISYSSN